jgi:hypothetical protein
MEKALVFNGIYMSFGKSSTNGGPYCSVGVLGSSTIGQVEYLSTLAENLHKQ